MLKKVHESWVLRAQQHALLQPQEKINNATTQNSVSVPCYGEGRTVVSVPILVNNVSAKGNCLYHATWLAATFSGVKVPFGFNVSDHIFDLRVLVAKKLYDLFQQQMVVNDSDDDDLSLCDLVAKPNEWTKYSGYKPLVTMALMLNRTIVILSCDGIMEVIPFNCSLVDNGLYNPIVLYHCMSGAIRDIVNQNERNHYAAVYFENSEDMSIFKESVANLRRSNRQMIDLNNLSPRNGLDQDMVVEKTVVENVKRKIDDIDSDDEFQFKRVKIEKNIGGDGQLVSLIERAMSLTELTNDELSLLRSGQNYTKNPDLALLYYHCCSCNPNTYITNDESLLDENESTKKLISTLEPINANKISEIQSRVLSNDTSNGDILACASCCEILNSIDSKIHKVSIENLHIGFQYTNAEREIIFKLPTEIKEKHRQYVQRNDILYHLNPELVVDINAIVLCDHCMENPREQLFSIANGHDYGRYGELPELNDIALGCISPIRHFGVEVTVSGKHSIGHSICFPSDGPQQCSNVIPQLSDEKLPRISFIGPREKWRIVQKKYRHLYNLPVESMYKWMKVLVHLHSFYKENDIIINESDTTKQNIVQFERTIEENVLISDSTDAENIDDKIIQERYGEDYNENATDCIIKKSAVLHSMENCDSPLNSGIEAMLDIIGDQVIPIQREGEPICEWFNNGKMIAGTFPQLFLTGGHCLPMGTWPTKFIEHLMKYYDGRFEQNTMFVATLFNQLQRHSAVSKSASIATSRAKVLEKLGKLANSKDFQEKLTKAKLNPHSTETKKLNASLNRLISLVGGCVPFSPFERSATRPKFFAMRCRYGIPLHWMTIAPPEHDDLELQRIAMIRSMKRWNDTNSIFTQKKCTFDNFHENVSQNARTRLNISAKYPALSANVFKRRMRMLYNNIVLRKANEDVRICHDYGMYQKGAYGEIAAHAGVIEPQRDGRLHQHMVMYGSTINPEFLIRIASSKQLSKLAAQWLDSICCTHLKKSVHKWHDEILDSKEKMPRAYEIELPFARDVYEKFVENAQKRMALTNFHCHCLACMYGKRGKYMCRLARPSGTHERETCPIKITRDRRGNVSKKIKPVLKWTHLTDDLRNFIDAGYDIDNGKLFRDHTDGPLLWELHRPSSDNLVVETNLTLASTIMSHTNSAIVNGEDAGDMIEEYQENYMTKNDVALKGAALALLAAIEHMAKFPSKSDNSNTELRRGQYLATRTINSFSGAHEWSHALMVYAITGNRSFISSHNFWYIFPYALMEFMKSADENIDEIEENEDVEQLADKINDEDNTQPQKSSSHIGGGVRTYKVKDKVVLLSQAESYLHRGEFFEHYSPLEFECIVDIKEVKENQQISNRGRPRRNSFRLGKNHLLYSSHEAFIRTKMPTAIFGGAPPPKWIDKSQEEESKQRNRAAQYIISTFTPWKKKEPMFEYNEKGLLELCKQWDTQTSSLINKQRVRYIRNVLKKGHRNSINEEICTDWRNRDVEFWDEHTKPSVKAPLDKNHYEDPELQGSLNNVDLYDLLTRMTNQNRQREISAIELVIQSNIPDEFTNKENVPQMLKAKNAIFPGSHGILTETAKRLKCYQRSTGELLKNSEGFTIHDPLASNAIDISDSDLLSDEQKKILNTIMKAIDKKEQVLTMIHAGGGTGKSFLVRAICNQIKYRKYETVSTCPTGAGACQLTEGRTFHAAFRTNSFSERMSAKTMDFLRNLFHQKILLVTIDEVSMLSAHFLHLLDKRLRMLYEPNKTFGGRSILMTGDFLQLTVINGVPLCKLMYMSTSDTKLKTAKHLFSLFTVYSLDKQQRASNCKKQQELLEKFRQLPPFYPQGNKWTSNDSAKYKPIDKEIVSILTKEIMDNDIQQDPSWLKKSTILVTSNLDRTIINANMAKVLANKNNEILIKWKKKLRNPIHPTLEKTLYNEQEHPELFGYFFKNAPGQILDNSNGNVNLGVANGTRCWYHSVGWEDEQKTKNALKQIEESIKNKESIVCLREPPDFINVELADRNGNRMNPNNWPPEMTIDITREKIIIPIGIISSNSKDYSIKIHSSDEEHTQLIHYQQHAVELAMALTVWKSQGSTFDRVILLLEGSNHAPKWQFEHLYVALSRVSSIDKIRCFSTSIMFNKKRLFNLRPNIFTTKWRMSIDSNGKFVIKNP